MEWQVKKTTSGLAGERNWMWVLKLGLGHLVCQRQALPDSDRITDVTVLGCDCLGANTLSRLVQSFPRLAIFPPYLFAKCDPTQCHDIGKFRTNSSVVSGTVTMSRAFQRLSSQVLQQYSVPKSLPACHRLGFHTCHSRSLSTNRPFRRDEYEEKARKLNQKGLDEQEQQVRVREHQVKRPWHRDDADKPPAEMSNEEPEPVIGTHHTRR